MTAPLSRRKQMQILRLYFQGLSYDKIRLHSKSGKGSVEMVVDRLRAGAYEEFQDVTEEVDVLREIALYVKKHMDGDLERCHVGCVAWAALNRMGVEPSQVKAFAALFEELAPPDAPKKEFVETALWCDRLQKELGVSILELPRLIETLQDKVAALNARLDALQSEVHTAEARATLLRTELGFLQDTKDLRKVWETEQVQAAEAKGQASSALKESGRTLQDLEKFRAFAAAAKARDVPADGELLDTLLELIASLGPRGIHQVAELNASLAKEGLEAQEGVGLLAGLQRRGFTARQASAIVRALSARGPFSRALNHLISLLDRYETLDVAVVSKAQLLEGFLTQGAAARNEVLRLEKAQATLRASIEDMRRQGKEAADRFEKRQREAEEKLASTQRKADERLQATEKRRKEFEEYARKLGARNMEVGAEIMGLNERLPALRGEVKEMTRQRDEAKALLEAALGVQGEWEEIERALQSANEKGQRELKELEGRIQGERDILALAEHLKRALGGDPRYARSLFGYYASEPRIPPGRHEPVPDPDAARERIVAKAFELLGDQAVRRQEFEQAEQRHKAESEATSRIFAESKARTEELERTLQDRGREVNRLSRELASTKQSLEWCWEARRGASRRTAPPKAPGPSAPQRTP